MQTVIQKDDENSPFRNRLLVAMPGLHAGTFDKSVIYLCAHSAAGAMGLVVNQSLPDVDFGELLEQLHLPHPAQLVAPVVHFGGPVDTGRGFVLHSTDFMRADTVRVDDGLCITGTVDIIRAIAEGNGPGRSIFALGYAGWGPGQLEAEMQANSWLVVPADEELLFSVQLDRKWERALGRLGVDPSALSMEAGRA
jgi:putative transcriptional regulator